VFKVKKIKMSLLHQQYLMEMFRLETDRIEVHYETFYDHAIMTLNLHDTKLYDLTGYPYTINPKQFYENAMLKAQGNHADYTDAFTKQP